jgi:hypothetical protein
MLFRAHMRAPAAIPWIPRMERRAYDPTGTRLAVSHVVPGGVTGLAEALIESFGGGFGFRSCHRLPGNYQLVDRLDGKNRISTEKSASVYSSSPLGRITGISDR